MEKNKHSPFPWYQSSEMVIMCGAGKEVQAVAYASKEDGEIIVAAVNGTYGMGIDPSITNVVPDDGSGKRCLNCRYWRDKAWTDKGWGICDNPKNEVYTGVGTTIASFVHKDDEEFVRNQIEDGIRYPEDFGCIFFEALEGS